jgi:two-component system response regulator MprA
MTLKTSRYRILCVDDEPSVRESSSMVLASEGYEVITAEDGLDALDKLAEATPDLIISDLRMPRMSGFEFLEIVRDKFPKIPVIAVSGQFISDELPEGLHADVFLQKGGHSIAELFAQIEQLLKNPPRWKEQTSVEVPTA